jgi:hypothetical protein
MTQKDIRREFRKSTGKYPAGDECSLNGNFKLYEGEDLMDYIDWLEEKLIESKHTLTQNKSILIT